MIRGRLVFATFGALLLASACGGSSPTPTPVPPLAEYLIFQGKLIGHMTSGQATGSCGKTDKGGYTASWSGDVAGQHWTVSFTITSYRGPREYTIVQGHTGTASLTDSAGKQEYVLIQGALLINKDEKSGIIRDLEFATAGGPPIASSVQITKDGTWTCAS